MTTTPCRIRRTVRCILTGETIVVLSGQYTATSLVGFSVVGIIFLPNSVVNIYEFLMYAAEMFLAVNRTGCKFADYMSLNTAMLFASSIRNGVLRLSTCLNGRNATH